MRRRLSVILALLVIASMIALPASAQTQPDRQPPVSLQPVTEADLDGPSTPSRLPNARGASSVANYVVQFADAPLAERWLDAQARGAAYDAATAQAYTDSLLAKQAQASAAVEALGGKTLANFTKLLNGIAVEISGAAVRDLYAIPGVVSVSLLPDYELDLNETVPWIGAAALQSAGYDGSGITVAVLDSGIDYTHAHLGGSGLQADTNQALAEASQPADPALYPTAKVIGGYDFVGSVWPNGDLMPDPNPMDDQGGGVEGHGTHVSSIIAGVETDVLGPGVAPGAELYALKVCSSVATSCSGVALMQSYEWAADPNGDGMFDDRADVVNLSLGALYGQPNNSSTVAMDMLTSLGSVVVASAGNSGNTPYISGSPSVARSAIGVAQTTVPSAALYRLRRETPSQVIMDAAFQPWSVTPTTTITGDIVYGNGDGTNLLGCDPYTADLTGKVALIDRGVCAVSIKFANASAAGAEMAVMALIAPGPPLLFSYGGGDVTIPGFVVTQADGTLLKAAGASVTVDPTDPTLVIPLVDVMVASSSRGPAFDAHFNKPDIGAPGASVSASSGNQSYSIFGGTSGSAPMVAGAAAQILQKAGGSGSLPPVVVKALLMNNAVTDTWQDVPGGMLNPISRQGAGRVDVAASAAAETIAWVPADNDVALSFGFETVSDHTMASKTVEVINTSGEDKTYAIGAGFRYADDVGAGVDVMLSADTLTVPAGGVGTFDVTLHADPTMFKPWPFTSGGTMINGDLLTAVEFDGFLTLSTPARVRVVHASPDAPAVDILVNDAVVLSNVPFTAVSDYLSVPAGTYNVKVVPTGATTPVVIEADLTVAGGTDYTVAAVGELANIEPLVLVDNNAKPAMGNAHVRFVHASPDAPAVDIALADGGPVLFGNVAFKEAQGPIPVPAGTYDLEVRLAGTSTVVLPLPGVMVADQTVYTVFAMGLAGGEPALQAVPAVDAAADAARSEVINLPWHYLPRAAAEVMVADPVQTGAYDFDVTLMNGAAVDGAVEVYPLFDMSPEIVLPPGTVNEAPADIKYVGADALRWNATSNLLLFALNTWNSRSHPINIEFDVWIDADQDGVYDYIAFNTLAGGTGDPRPVSALLNLATGTAALQFFLDTTINSETMVIPVIVPDADMAFDFQVFSFDAYFTGTLWDTSPADALDGAYHSFDAMMPAFVPDAYAFDVPAGGEVTSMAMGMVNNSPSQTGLLYLVRNGVTGGEAFGVEFPVEIFGEVMQTASTNPIVNGTYIDVDVMASNSGDDIVDALFLAPIDPDTMYVAGSAYGGAMPLTAAEAMAKGLTELAAGRAPEDVVAVGWMDPFLFGDMVAFGFLVRVMTDSGEVQHDVTLFDGATFVAEFGSDVLTITDNTGYPVSRSRRFNVARDTFINGAQPGTFYGSAQSMWTGFFGQMRPLVQTPISGIPGDAYVDVAYLYLYIVEGRGFSNWANSVINVQAHQVSGEWMPVAVNWWMPWNMPGGDYGPAIGANHIGSGKLGTWLRLEVTDGVTDFLRGASNQGFIITNTDNKGVRYALATKEYFDASKIGYIRVYFRTAN